MSNRGFLKHSIVMIVIISLLLTPTAMTPKKADAVGPIGGWAINKVLDTTLALVDDAFMSALGYAVNESGNESLTAVYDFLNGSSLFGDPTKKACDEILSELNHIEDRIDQVDKDTQKKLSEIFKYEIEANVQVLHGNIAEVYNNCDKIIKSYDNYVSAVSAYAEATDKYNENPGNSDLKSKMDKSAKDAKAKQGILEDDFSGMDFKKSLDTIAKNSCAYFPDYNKDHDIGKNINENKKFIKEQYLLLQQSVPFDHQIYDGMIAAINDTAKSLTTLLRANEIYVNYLDAKYQSNMQNAINDGSINNAVIKKQLDKDSDTLDKEVEKCEQVMVGVGQSLNDISTQYKPEMEKLMKPYDVAARKQMNFENPGTHTYKFFAWGLTSSTKYSAYAKYSQKYMDFNRVAVNGKPYLVLKDYNLSEYDYSYYFYNHDVSAVQKTEYYLPSQDYWNLTSTADGQYRLFSSVNDLTGFVDTPCYGGTGNNVVNYLKSGGLENVPLKNISYIASSEADDKVDYEYSRQNMIWNFYWYTPDFNPSNAKKYTKKVPLKGVSSSGKLITILKRVTDSTESYPVISKRSDSRGTVEITDEKGKAISSDVPAGAKLNIKVTMQDGIDLASLALVTDEGKTLDTLATAETFNAVKDNKNSYTFSYTMPYQKAIFEAKFVKAEREGDGSSDAPFKVGTAEELVEYFNLAKDNKTRDQYSKANYILTNNIDMTEFNDGKIGYGFDNFYGRFDGNGKTIKGFTYPIFRSIKKDALVKDITLDVVNGNSANKFATFLSMENGGTIDGCSVICTNKDGYFGADRDIPVTFITGDNAGTIKNCSNIANLYSNNANGLAGNNVGKIINCYNTGNIDSNKSMFPNQNLNMAGIAMNSGSASIENCYFGGSMVYSGFNKSVFAPISHNKGSVKTAWYDSRYSGIGDGTALNEEQMNQTDYLLDLLNKGVGTDSTLNTWQREYKKNGDYPFFGDKQPRFSVSTDIKGEGDVEIVDEAGDPIKSATAGLKISAKLTPGDGYEIGEVTVLNKDGAVIDTPNVGADDTVALKMPHRNVMISVSFVRGGSNNDTSPPDNGDGTDNDTAPPDNGDGTDNDTDNDTNPPDNGDGADNDTTPADNGNGADTDTEWPIIKEDASDGATPGAILSVDKDTVTIAGTKGESLTWSLDDFGPRTITDQTSGLIITGSMINKNTQILIEKIDPQSKKGRDLVNTLGDDVLYAYDISLVFKDKNGKTVKSEEPTFAGDLNLSFPIKDEDKEKNLQLAHGSVIGFAVVEDVEVEDNMLKVGVTHLSPFAIVDHSDEIVENLSDPDADADDDSAAGTESKSDNKGIPAFIVALIIALVLLLVIAGVMYYRRKSKKAKTEADEQESAESVGQEKPEAGKPDKPSKEKPKKTEVDNQEKPMKDKKDKPAISKQEKVTEEKSEKPEADEQE